MLAHPASPNIGWCVAVKMIVSNGSLKQVHETHEGGKMPSACHRNVEQDLLPLLVDWLQSP